MTSGAIERIRGVDSDYTIRTLLHRRLVVELGRSEAPGRPFLYGTGFEFLERFGLTSLEELPPLDVDVAARLRARRAARPLTELDVREREAAASSERRRRTPADAGRAAPEGARGRGGRVAAGERGADRRRAASRSTGGAATIGQQVDPDEAEIEVDGRRSAPRRATTYLLLHKPAGVTSTTRDRHADTTVLDLVPTALVPDGARLYPVGRLDQDSEGMLLLTNDGGVVRARAPSAVRRGARVRAGPARPLDARPGGGTPARASRSRRASRRSGTCGR